MASGKSGYPSLQPAYILKLIAGEGHPVGETSSGPTFVHYSTSGGSITTVDGFEPKVEAEVVFGGDWLNFDPDKAHSRPNVQGIAKTAQGSVIRFGYTGVSGTSEDLEAIFNHQPTTIAFGLSTTHHTFEVGDPSLKVLENSTWVGNGRFLFEDDKLMVETRISKVVASTEMD